MQIKIAPCRVGDLGRIATVVLRAGPVTLKQPRVSVSSTHPRQAALIAEIAAWEDSRNKKPVKADRHFITADARMKLKCLARSGAFLDEAIRTLTLIVARHRRVAD
jgi:hypothetical protein